MDQSFAKSWKERFGGELPQWVERVALAQPQEDCVRQSEKRVSELTERLEQETFVLSWLQQRSKTRKATINASDIVEPSSQSASTKLQDSTSPSQSPLYLRRRAFEHVNLKDVKAAQRVSLKLKQSGKHLSSGNIDFFEYSPSPKHLPLSRERSMSDSVVTPRTDVEPIPEHNRLSPIPDTPVKQVSDPQNTQQSTQVNTDNMEVIQTTDTSNFKRLSNGTQEAISDDEGNEIMDSVRTVVSTTSTSPNQLFIRTSEEIDDTKRRSWLECSGTLKRGIEFQNSIDGEKTPTGSLDTSVDALEKGITLSMASDARYFSLDRGLNLKEAEETYTSQDRHGNEGESDGEEDEVRSQNEETGSMNDLEHSGYHNYSNLAESTLTYILRDTIFASRSNSVSSLSGPDPFSPELTPSHEVNLRSNGKRKDRNRITQERNRTAQVLREFGSNDDITDEAKLQKMLADLQDSSPSSPSSELSSEPSSPSHLVPYVKPVSMLMGVA